MAIDSTSDAVRNILHDLKSPACGIPVELILKRMTLLQTLVVRRGNIEVLCESEK